MLEKGQKMVGANVSVLPDSDHSEQVLVHDILFC